jgi:predicted O-methyltransferase YrrM
MLLTRLARTARAYAAVTTRPPWVKPGHFYSPSTSPEDVRRALAQEGPPPGVDLNEGAQITLAERFAPVLREPLPGPRYKAPNRMYCPADAAVYRAMLQYVRPQRIIEAGSGYSTAVALDEADRNPALAALKVTCVEPYPDRLLALLPDGDGQRLRLLREPVQDVSLGEYGALEANDILFIDSTHVVKPGSDVVHLLLHVLPRLPAGVVVHVHDMFYPFTYPAKWLAERRDWTEAYLMHALLAGSEDWRIMFWPSWLWKCHLEMVPGALRTPAPGSLWLRKLR